MTTTSDPKQPNYLRPELAAVQPDLELADDLLAGTRRMWDRAQAKEYIRKWADEKQEVYDIRRKCETVFEGLGRILAACVGMLYAKPPAMVWNASESAMTEHYGNLDGAGTAGAVLCKRFSEKALRDGFGVILVDHPPTPKGPDGQPVPVTAANEGELGLRPTWAIYNRIQAINWYDDLIANRRTLTQLTLSEPTTVRDGPYGIKTVKRYRDLRLAPGPDGLAATWILWEETNDPKAGGFRVVDAGLFRNRNGEVANFLPVAIAYTGRTDAPMTATLPLMGVAWENLAHWQISTDLRFAEMVASYAQGVVTGELASDSRPDGTKIPGKVRLGPLVTIHLTGEGAGFDWKAPPVDAFEPLEKRIAEKEKHIAALGMSFIVADTRAERTAEAKRLDATAENSTLATAAQGIEDAWNRALEIDAWYHGIEKAGAPVMTISRDFDSVALDPQTMVAYVDAVARAGLPPRLLLEAWQRGGRIPAETDLDELEMQMEARRVAQEEAAQEQARLQAQPLKQVA